MNGIDFYGKERNPTELIIPRLDSSRHVLDGATEIERHIIADTWNKKSRRGWTDGKLGSLQNTASSLKYIGSDFSVYLAVTDPEVSNRLSRYLVDISRSSSVGSALQTADGYFIVQRRGENVANANLRLDSSVSGMVNAIRGELDFKNSIIQKAAGELKLSPEDITNLNYTGVHKAIDFTTAQVTLTGKVSKELEEIRRATDPEFTGDSSRIAGVYGVKKENLADYLIDNSGNDGFIDDGIAAFMQVLDDEMFFTVAQELARRGRRIRFGDLVNGEFLLNEKLEERLRIS